MKKIWLIGNADVLFLFVTVALCNFPILPEIARAFLALPAFLIIPYRFGNILVIATSKLLKNIRFDLVSNIILSWSVGTISLLLLAILLNELEMFNATSYVLLILVMVFVSPILNTIHRSQKIEFRISNRKSLNAVCGDYRVIFLVLIIALFPVTYFMSFTDFPLAIGIDTFAFILNTNQIIQDNYLELFSTWGSMYPPTLPIFFAINSLLFNVSALSLCWTLPFLLYPLFSLGIYLFSYQLSKRWEISFIAAVIAVASTGFSKWVFINSLYYIAPKNLIYLIFPFLLFFVQKNVTSRVQAHLSTSHDNHYRNSPCEVRWVPLPRRNKMLSILLGVITSTLIFSVFSLSFSLAPHHFPHTYVILVAILLFFLFTILAFESFGRKRLEAKMLILVSVVIDVFFVYSMFTLLPLSEQEIPHLKIFLGIAATVLILPFLLIGEIRKRIAPRYFLLFCVVSLVSFLFHFFMGLVLVFLIYFYNLSRLITERAPLKAMVILGSIIGLSSLLVVLQQYDVASLTQMGDVIPSMFETGREFDLSQKNEMLVNTFHGVVVMFSILGTIVLFAREKLRALPVACLFSLTLFIYFLPALGVYRFLTFLTPLLSFLAANALFVHDVKLPILSRTRSAYAHRSEFKKKALRGLYVLIIILFLVPFIAQSHIITVSVLCWSPYFSPSTLSFDEVEAANWISQNTPKDTLVISEPNTRVIVGALANREESSFFNGASSVDLRTVFMTTNASEAHQLILQYRQLRIEYDEMRANRGSHFLQGNRPVIVVINGRVSRMIENPNAKSGPNVPVWFKPFGGFNKFHDSVYFMPLHNVNDQVYVFAAKIVGTAYAS